MSMEIEEIKSCALNEIKDQTWGTGIMQKRLVLVAVKQNGVITEAEKHELLSMAWKKATDNGTMSIAGTGSRGQGLLLVFDVYMIEQLSVLKRLCHALRMFKAAVTCNINISSGVRVVVIK